MATEDTISSAIDFFDIIKGEDEVTIKFIKKDGTERIMKCTLNFERIPSNKHPRDVNMGKILRLLQNNRVIHVYDTEKNDWRSVPFDTAEWIQTSERGRLKIVQ